MNLKWLSTPSVTNVRRTEIDKWWCIVCFGRGSIFVSSCNLSTQISRWMAFFAFILKIINLFQVFSLVLSIKHDCDIISYFVCGLKTQLFIEHFPRKTNATKEVLCANKRIVRIRYFPGDHIECIQFGARYPDKIVEKLFTLSRIACSPNCYIYLHKYFISFSISITPIDFHSANCRLNPLDYHWPKL